MSERLRRLMRNSWVQAGAIGALCGLILFTVAIIWRSARDETIVLEVQPLDDPQTIHVYVGGEVVHPGIYALPRGSRVANALDAAGGVTEAGDTSRLGMAAVVEDSDQIIVARQRPFEEPGTAGEQAEPKPAAPTSTTPLNINQASATELEILPGIGPRLAERIVAYRSERGPFQTVDELGDIAGISSRMVEELRPLVSTGP